MSQKERIKGVAFIDTSLKKAFEELKSGKYEDQYLAGFLNRAMEDLKQNPLCGIRIPSGQWPKNTSKNIA